MLKGVRRVAERAASSLASRFLSPYSRSDTIWSGVYSEFYQVPAQGPGFHGVIWRDMTLKYTRQVLTACNTAAPLPVELRRDTEPLAILAATVSQTNGRISILDFGGGLGASYLALRQALRSAISVDYRVVETEGLCSLGRQLFSGDGAIQFLPELPSSLPALDIVFVCSALQYVPDYQGLLGRLAEYRPAFILLVKTSAGDIPTYATAQVNVPESVIPFWFINVGELVDRLQTLGYRLQFRGLLEREYHQLNLPSEFRLKRACNLLFSRTDPPAPRAI